jgi:hypothetical protein
MIGILKSCILKQNVLRFKLVDRVIKHLFLSSFLFKLFLKTFFRKDNFMNLQAHQIDLVKARCLLSENGINVYESRYGWGYTGCDCDHFTSELDAVVEAIKPLDITEY